MAATELAPPAPSPGETLCALVGGAAALFYWFEKDDNPSVKTYWDALHYVSTSLSVGYANLFPVTPAGKLLASILMTVGPSLAARALDSGHDDGVAARLDEVLVELRKLNATLAGAAPAPLTSPTP
jgi:hypothetical protein